MTYKEKLQQEHPEMINKKGECWNCPHDYGYCENPPIEHCRSMNCNACWEREIQSAEPSCDDVKAAYDQGLEDAWELVKRVVLSPEYVENAKIFLDKNIVGIEYNRLLKDFFALTPQEALAKLKAYEEAQKIKVGNEIVYEENKKTIIVSFIDEQLIYGFDREGKTICTPNNGKWKKTGKHIDVQSILSQIGGE